MSRRVFIAINLPEEIKRKLTEIQQKWADLPVRWTKKVSLHITLVFLGYVNEQDLYQICDITKKVTKSHQPFFINFKKVLLGPPGRSPRMIWIEGEKNLELSVLRNNLENSLSSEGPVDFKPEGRPFSPHITLARIRTEEWKELPEVPKIEEEINLNFAVNSIEVMESQLLRDGAEYTILESVELG